MHMGEIRHTHHCNYITFYVKSQDEVNKNANL